MIPTFFRFGPAGSRRMIPATGMVLVLAVLGGFETAQGQERGWAPDAFLDPAAETLYRAANANWRSIDESVVRYTAVIRQRIAAGIRTPLKDRTIYRNESAVRAFWDRDYDALVQVLGVDGDYPGREESMAEEAFSWLGDLTIDEPFEPGGDRLFFGMGGQDEDLFSPDNDDFWFAHPLARGSDTLYQYQSGDTLTLSLPDGRRLFTIQLDVLPRVADVHRISGSLWIEPETGALVRAVYRLAKQFDVVEDVPEVKAEDEAGEFDMVPGLLKPWTFDLSVMAVEYSLWNFQVWLPRSFRFEGEAAAGILKIPITMDVAYDMESVTTQADLDAELAEAEAEAPAAAPQPGGLIERHFDTRAEAMAFLAQVLSEQDGVNYQSYPDRVTINNGRTTRYLVPESRAAAENSPYLPPPVWEDAPGFASEDELAEMMETLADLPPVPTQGIPWDLNWGWAREDLLRYNRVEGPAIGGRFDTQFGSFLGPVDIRASGFFGFADLEPKARLTFERASVKRRVALSGYRELRAVDPNGRYLGLGNSMNAFFFGRDDGEYYLGTGADLVWRPPEATRQSYKLRVYAERQDPLENNTDFALFRAFDGDGTFRSNVEADLLEEAGGELTISPWWGSAPNAAQFGLELFGQGATWRHPDSTATEGYGRASAILRVALPLFGPEWRMGLEAGGGTSWGEVPLQRNWFLGGPINLRGYDASVIHGTTFARGRVELARVFPQAVTVSAFGDVGWAGLRDDLDTARPLYGIGFGASLLDGLVRMDLSHGLRGPEKRLRFDLYLDAIL